MVAQGGGIVRARVCILVEFDTPLKTRHVDEVFFVASASQWCLRRWLMTCASSMLDSTIDVALTRVRHDAEMNVICSAMVQGWHG